VEDHVERVTSLDGTPIAYYRNGAGAPLLLVHGTGATNARWRSILPRLEKHFCVYLVDRRGQGESGDNDIYSIKREFEDIATVVDAVRTPVNLLGHSFGGLCALEAALLTRNLRKLVVYEPALPPNIPPLPEGVIDQLQALSDAGDREGVLTKFLREVVRLPPHELERFRASHEWSARLAIAHTLPRELRAQGYEFNAQRFKGVKTPTLLLLGSNSPDFVKAPIEALDTIMPNSQIAVMPGHKHVAMDTAPDLFLYEVIRFLIGSR
jgi:pimeloyl-ACP methyl ester carboxylesterase